MEEKWPRILTEIYTKCRPTPGHFSSIVSRYLRDFMVLSCHWDPKWPTISWRVSKVSDLNHFLTCRLTKGQQVISSAFFRLFCCFLPPFLSGGITNAKYQIQMNIAFIILYRTPSELKTKVKTWTLNPNLDWTSSPYLDRTLTKPWPNLDQT